MLPIAEKKSNIAGTQEISANHYPSYKLHQYSFENILTS